MKDSGERQERRKPRAAEYQAPFGPLQFRLEPHEQGIQCTRTLLQGVHEQLRLTTIVRSSKEWREFIQADEYYAMNRGFFLHLQAAGDRMLRRISESGMQAHSS